VQRFPRAKALLVPSAHVHEAGAHWEDASHAVGAGYGALQVGAAVLSEDVQPSAAAANASAIRRSPRAIVVTVA
jgi:hypothetical protein